MNETTQTPATIVHGARIVSTRAAEHASIALDTDSAWPSPTVGSWPAATMSRSWP